MSAALDGLLAQAGLTLLEREPSATESTHRSEVLTCHDARGEPVVLYCKRAAGPGPQSYGHRGGVPHEALVYQRLLARLPATRVPRFHGTAVDPAAGETILLLEHLGEVERLNKSDLPDAMPRAARWLGAFHAACSPPPAFLPLRDAAYYGGWAERTRAFAAAPPAWLDDAIGGLAACWRDLAARADTVVHGEYYPKNVLLAGGEIRPVDWESAAIGAGEVDLASLVAGWPAETVEECASAYAEARWGGRTPAGFREALDAAHAHMLLRWLGDRPDWTNMDSSADLFGDLHNTCRRLGLL